MPPNSTVQIILNYAAPFDFAGTQATKQEADNALGFLAIPMEQAWLNNFARNNLSTTMVSYVKGSSEAAKQYTGPIVSLTSPPPQHLPPSTGPGINKAGLEIGLPIVLAFVIVCLFGVCWWNRKSRKIGPVKWRKRDLGYGTRQSGRQRMGLGKKGADAQARERELVAGERGRGRAANGYSDEPFSVGDDHIDGPWELNERKGDAGTNGHARDASLGSLVGDGNELEMNDFRREIGRQQQEGRR